MQVLKRAQHTLQPQRWRLIAIITDTPGPGETHLSGAEITDVLTKALDLPAGLAFEIGTVEKAAGPPPRSDG